MKTYYEILELSPQATNEEIKEQYRFLIQAWHPDKVSNPAQKTRAQEKAKEINLAFDTLGKPEKRRQYDQGLITRDPRDSSQPTSPRASPAKDPWSPSASGWERPEGHWTAPPTTPWTGISPLADFKWLLLFGDEHTYVLDDRETAALGGGDFQYHLADWPVFDHHQVRCFWQKQGYQVEVIESPYKLVAGESSRCLTGQASLTAVNITLDRESSLPLLFGILFDLTYLGENSQDRQPESGKQSDGIANPYYSFCVDCTGRWEFRHVRSWRDERGTLVEHGYTSDIPRAIQRGRPLELVGVIRNCPPPDREKVRVRLGRRSRVFGFRNLKTISWRSGEFRKARFSLDSR